MLTSSPTIPEVVFERIKSDITELAFNFFQDGVSLDVAARQYKIRLKASGIQALEKPPATNAAGRVTFVLSSADKTPLNGSEYQISLVELITGGERTIVTGTLRWSVPSGKTIGLVIAPDVSVNYIAATGSLMVALGVVDFGSSSSALSAAAAAGSATLAETEAGIAEDHADAAIAAKNQTNDIKAAVDVTAGQVTTQLGLATSAAATAQSLRDATAILKDQAVTIVTNQVIYKGLWDASTNTPALSTVVPIAGTYYEVGKTGTQNITGTAILYSEGQKVVSNGLAWELSKGGLIPGNKTVTVEKMVDWLQLLFQQLPDDSIYFYAITDIMNRLAFGIRKDGFIEGKFVINAINMMVNSVATAAIQNNAITPAKLSSDLSTLINTPFDNTYSDYLYLVLDAANRIGIGLKKDGTLVGKFQISDLSISESKIIDLSVSAAKLQSGSVTSSKIADAAVTLSKLAQEVKDSFPTQFNADESEYLYLLLDSQNRIGVGIKKDGTFVGKIPVGADGSVTLAKLAAEVSSKLITVPFNRLNAANAYDLETDLEDDWREALFTYPVKTAVNGYAYTRFSPGATKSLRGLNSTGTALQFRQSNRINIKGRRYRGTFDPTSSGVIGTNYRGTYGNSYTPSYPAFTVGAVGDCWMANVANTSGTTITANGLTFKNGDLIVQTGTSTYAVQPGPGDGSFVEGDFWNVTATSQFGKIQLVAGERILYVGVQSQSGPKFVQFTPSKAGEFYIMGECNPAAFSPQTPVNGDLYICSAAGTAQSLVVSESDSLAYESGWFVVPGNVKTVANGAVAFLPCSNANEWEVRRLDKSNTQALLNLSGSRTTIRRRINDVLRLLSDSMFGSGGIATKILALAAAGGRSGSYRSDGGATSEDILAMLKMDVRTTDAYAGQFHIIWHGQNNPSATIDMVQSCALQMAAILGAKQKRFMFWSILGPRTLTYNGTRMVATNQEGAFAGTNYLANIEKWYDVAFPKQWWSPRKAALELAVTRTTIPDPNFPGMSEAQVAATYGILPFSFFFDYSTKPFTATQLVYKGDWTSAALPTDPGTTHDYYRRTGGGTIGTVIAYEAGAWTEYAPDVIHLTNAGGDAMSVKFYDYLTSINL